MITLLVGCLVLVAVARAISALVPVTILSDETSARTKPTIVNLAIALATGTWFLCPDPPQDRQLGCKCGHCCGLGPAALCYRSRG